MILQNWISNNHFGCTVIFAIIPSRPTIITSTAFLVLAAFCTQYQSVVTFISFPVLVWCMYTLTVAITISTSYISIGHWQYAGIDKTVHHLLNSAYCICMQIHRNKYPNASCLPHDKRLLCHVSVGSKSPQYYSYGNGL